MKKIGLLVLSLLTLTFHSFCQKAEFVPPKDIPRNIIIVLANGMGMNQITATAFKKGSMPSFVNYPVYGFTQAWSTNTQIPTDSSLAYAMFRENLQNRSEHKNSSKCLFDLASEKKMFTGIITTGLITAPIARDLLVPEPDNKDPETLANDYLNANVNIIMGGGSRYFDRRYDGMNLFKIFMKKGFKIESNIRNVGNQSGLKTMALVSKYDLFRASERKDYLTKASISAMRALTNADGYLLVIENTKIKEADTLNNTELLTEEILDLDKLCEEIKNQAGANTLVIVLGVSENGGAILKSNKLDKKKQPEIIWTNKSTSASLAPVYAFGTGSEEFAGIYSLSEVYIKLNNLMIKRR